jgi:hypothetical protein
MTMLRFHRLAPAMLLTAMLLSTGIAGAQDIDSPTLFFRPHCENPDATQCPFYDVMDPTTLATPQLAGNDMLDMDIVLFNPKSEKIKDIRVWLSYDPAVLQGDKITIVPQFPVIVPGQADFSPQTGQVKIAASATAGQEPGDPFLPLARVTFKVSVNAATGQSPIGFHDLQENLDGHVVVTSTTAPTVNMIVGPLGTLVANIQGTGAPSSVAASSVSAAPSSSSIAPVSSSSVVAVVASSSSVAPVATSSSVSSSSLSSSSSLNSSSSTSSITSSSSTSSAPDSAFELLQVQNVGIGTEDDTLKITWDPLSHPKLQGYNVYYGTLPGRYLQRKSVSVAAVGTIIRDLPRGETYYAAVRGVNDQNKETAFSDEVSVEIGNPATASAVLGSVTNLVDSGPGGEPSHQNKENPLDTVKPPKNVPGGTGVPADFMLLLGTSAATGTLFALRRQLTASKTRPK